MPLFQSNLRKHCGPAPRYNERRTLWFRFILAAQLPATASDGLYSSTFLSSLCDYFACCSLPLRYAVFLQNFCSAEICTTSLHQQGRDLFVHSLFNIFFSRNDIFNQRFRGAEGESYPQSPPAGALLLKKKGKKKEKDRILNFRTYSVPKRREYATFKIAAFWENPEKNWSKFSKNSAEVWQHLQNFVKTQQITEIVNEKN